MKELNKFSIEYFTNEVTEYLNQMDIEVSEQLEKNKEYMIGDNFLLKKTRHNENQLDLMTHTRLIGHGFDTYILFEQTENHTKTWMSLMPMEIQTQFVPIAMAEGKVAVGGAGMGYAYSQMAQKSNVDQIDVYEVNRAIIRFNKKLIVNLPIEINFINKDFRTIKNQTYDFMYNDIYCKGGSFDLIKDWEILTTNNNIGNYHGWSQEILLNPFMLFGRSPFPHFSGLDMDESLTEILNTYPFLKNSLTYYSELENADYSTFPVYLEYPPEFKEIYAKVKD